MCELTSTVRLIVSPVAISFTLSDLCSIEDEASDTCVHCTALEGGTSVGTNIPISNIAQVFTVNSCMCMVVLTLLIYCTHWHMLYNTDTHSRFHIGCTPSIRTQCFSDGFTPSHIRKCIHHTPSHVAGVPLHCLLAWQVRVTEAVNT